MVAAGENDGQFINHSNAENKIEQLAFVTAKRKLSGTEQFYIEIESNGGKYEIRRFSNFK